MDFIKPDSSTALEGMPGDPAAKFACAEPILRSVRNGRFIYRERFIAIVESPNLSFDEIGIRGDVRPVSYLFLPGYVNSMVLKRLKKGWRFSGGWRISTLSWTESGFLRIACPVGGWKIWPEAELVQRTGDLAEKGDMESALKLLGPSLFYI
jgi:hypothetical protein